VAFRRPPPSLLFTAVLATVLLVPIAVGTESPDRQEPPPAPEPTGLALLPLADVGAGETVREVGQAKPFSLVALTGADLSGTTTRVRARLSDGSWGPWYEAEALEYEGPDTGAAPNGTEPVFVGRTTRVQIAINRHQRVPAPAPAPAAGLGLGYTLANVEQPIAENVNAVLISPPQAPVDPTMPTAVTPPGQAPAIITRAQWGADESMRCGPTQYDNRIRAAVVHHTAGNNDYTPQDSAEIVRAIYAYHTRTLGWCDIAYNALVDRYGQVFEGRAGGINRAVRGSHTGGFNTETWGVALIGDFEVVAPTPVQLTTAARLIGWRMAMDGVDPRGTVTLTSAGGSFTRFPRGAPTTLPTIFTHRDVGITECPGNAAYAEMNHLRDMATTFNDPPSLADTLQGGAIYARWQAMGGASGWLGAPTSPESLAEDGGRYVRFDHGAIYWAPGVGAYPVGGAIYDAWAALGYERSPLGLPTSGEIPEAEWITQNFQHGTLNLDRQQSQVRLVMDGVAYELPPPSPQGPPAQIERFSRILP
jgi:uncharacterized protein with LGFP repeats